MRTLKISGSNRQIPDCDFCKEFAGVLDNPFARIYGPEVSRVIDSTTLMNVAPSLGQLSEGHLLIIPKRHVTAFADLEPAELEQVDEILRRYGPKIKRLYGKFVMFEHGTRACANSGGCGIVHAHLHLVPCKPAVLVPSELRMRSIALPTFTHLPHTVDQTRSYVFFRDQRMSAFIAEVDYLPSQYFRKLLADVLSVPVWDWRQLTYQDSLTGTLDRLNMSPSV